MNKSSGCVIYDISECELVPLVEWWKFKGARRGNTTIDSLRFLTEALLLFKIIYKKQWPCRKQAGKNCNLLSFKVLRFNHIMAIFTQIPTK